MTRTNACDQSYDRGRRETVRDGQKVHSTWTVNGPWDLEMAWMAAPFLFGPQVRILTHAGTQHAETGKMTTILKDRDLHSRPHAMDGHGPSLTRTRNSTHLNMVTSPARTPFVYAAGILGPGCPSTNGASTIRIDDPDLAHLGGDHMTATPFIFVSRFHGGRQSAASGRVLSQIGEALGVEGDLALATLVARGPACKRAWHSIFL